MTLGPPQQGGVPTHMITLIFLAVTGWNLLLLDLEERRWPKRAANLKKNAKMII